MKTEYKKIIGALPFRESIHPLTVECCMCGAKVSEPCRVIHNDKVVLKPTAHMWRKITALELWPENMEWHHAKIS